MKLKTGFCAHCVEPLENRKLLSGGYLDTSFSGDGLTTAKQSGFAINAVDVAVRSDGKFVVAATATSKTSNSTYMEVARFNDDGTLDTSFGSGGFSTSRIPGTAAAVAVQSDNKIVVVGSDPGQSGLLVARFTANGDLDTSFNHTGTELTTFDISGSGPSGFAADVAIQKDGKIVVVGSADTGGFLSSNFDAVVVRYNTSGSLDTSFASGGKADIGLGDREYGNALTIDYVGSASTNPDYGKIVVVGDAENTGGTTSNFMFIRLTTNGSVDKTFHKTGKFSSTFVSEYKWSDAKGVVVEPNNEIVVVGSVGPTNTSSHNFGVVRLNENGTGDSTFGPSNGQTEVDFGGNDAAHSVILSQTGDLLVGGVTGSKVAIVALESNGLIDTAFGPNGNGKVVTSSSDGGNIYTGGMTRTQGGKFIIAGGDNAAAEGYFDRANSTVTITATDPNASEQGQDPAVFTFSRPEVVNTPTRIYFSVGGTATSPFSVIKKFVDYTGITAVPLVNGTGSGGGSSHPLNTAYVDIPAGAKSATVTITPIDDKIAEHDETVIFTLLTDPGYDLNPAASPTATAVIHDNDAPETLLTPTADAYVRDGSNANTNYGSSTQLQVGKSSTTGNNRITYLKFDLTLAGTVVHNASIDIFGKLSSSSTTNLNTSIFSASTSWSESTIDYSNRPSIGSTALDTQAITDNVLRSNVFNVTAYVKAQIAAGAKTISFALKNPSGSGTYAIFDSKESGSSTTPELIIT